jgi:hypothetical protein
LVLFGGPLLSTFFLELVVNKKSFKSRFKAF